MGAATIERFVYKVPRAPKAQEKAERDGVEAFVDAVAKNHAFRQIGDLRGDESTLVDMQHPMSGIHLPGEDLDLPDPDAGRLSPSPKDKVF